ncbi:MAG: alanine--glyoxylate aminotransferase family protein [Candidatus Lokiarchaeota archaeon]|nr:alanine--glyoxylate aminotransferase family protein [Candidatus Lokiarchaeota archaeon]
MSDVHFNKNESSKLKLFTPGPVDVPDRVLQAMAMANDTHRSKPYSEMHKLAVEGLQKVLFTKNECLLYTTSASGVMEACVRNLIKEDEKALFLSIGAFGDRWYEIGVTNGKNSIKSKIEWGKAVTPELLKEELSKQNYDIVCLQSNETSTGVYNPLEELIPIIKESEALVCVDATSSLAGIKLEVDRLDIDVCLASVQKCLALPPGLAICSVSSNALEKTKEVKNRGLYLDFLSIQEKNKIYQTPNTPPIPQIRGLVVQLDYILNQEGLEKRFERHKDLGKRTREWAKDMGFEMFSAKGYESDTVSTMKNTIGIDFEKMVSNLITKGYRIVNGYGSLKNKTFRIGHMGEITKEELDNMLVILSGVIEELK